MIRPWLARWLRNKASFPWPRSASARKAPRRPRFRPQLEGLEDRLTPVAVRPLSFTTTILPGNDDGSTSLVPLPFTVNFFGVVRNALYVNNNGNVTFDQDLFTYTPFGLTSTQRQIIAPFFGDVDTRTGEVVRYGSGLVDGRRAFAVDWFGPPGNQGVGYYLQHLDKLNKFQLLLTESSTGPGDFDIEFNYDRIRWETGDASGGSGGLGGSSAHVGFSNGTGQPGTFCELQGSGVPGSFLDSNPALGLIYRSLNSDIPGRFVFFARNGVISDRVLTPVVVSPYVYVTGTEAGAPPHVRVFDATTRAERLSFLAYDAGYRGGVRVAIGDVNGDGVGDIITATGFGGPPHVKVFSGTDLSLLASFYAYAPTFRGGVFVACGDIDGDGRADIITGTERGPAHVMVFSGANQGVLRSFLAYAPTFLGGVRVASGDIDGDGRDDLVTGAGPGAGPHAMAFSGRTGAILRSFFAYSPSYRGGVFVSTGRFGSTNLVAVPGECETHFVLAHHRDIITGAGQDSAPHVQVFNGSTGTLLRSFIAGAGTLFYPDGNQFRNGVRVAAADTDLDGMDEVVVGYGPQDQPLVRAYDFATQVQEANFFSYDPRFRGGIWIAGGRR
jgi:hypothetical protein